MKPAMSFNLFCGKHNTFPLKLLFYFLVHVSVLPNGRTAYVPQKHAGFSLLLLTTQKCCQSSGLCKNFKSQMFVIVRFIRFFFSGEPLSLTLERFFIN